MFGKKIGQDFYEGKITLPIILLFQKTENNEKEKIKNIFLKDERDENELNYIMSLIKKYDVINSCYQKAQHYIDIASNSLSIFKDCEEKKILKKFNFIQFSKKFLRT